MHGGCKIRGNVPKNIKSLFLEIAVDIQIQSNLKVRLNGICRITLKSRINVMLAIDCDKKKNNPHDLYYDAFITLTMCLSLNLT